MTSRVVVVTGASAGLGREMTLALLDAGHRVVAVARTAEPLAALAAEAVSRGGAARLCTVAADVAVAEACEGAVATALERFGALHGVVSNAGINLPTPAPGTAARFWDVDPAAWRAIFATNVDGAFFLARSAVPHLVAAGWGRIVNHVTSYRTMVRGGETPYGPSKAALEAATAAWAAELDGSGVTVNAILPGGASDTRMVSRAAVPDRGKLVPPSVMRAPVRWLFSSESDGVTGRRIVAALWNPDADHTTNVANAVSRAGWPETVAAAPARPWPPA